MALELRDKRKKARKQLLVCLFIVIVVYLANATASFALNRSSLNLSDQVVFPKGETASSYDKLSDYNSQGWKYISGSSRDGNDTWNSYESPHGGFSATSNKCRVCHALHRANQNSYRLLFDNSRLTACDRCHDPVTGLSGKKPYRLFSNYQINKKHDQYNRTDSGKAPEKPRIIEGKPIIIRSSGPEAVGSDTPVLLPDPSIVNNAKGEHTPGATSIPESTIPLPGSFQPDGLTCYSCHDPHFDPNNTIINVNSWNKKGAIDPSDSSGQKKLGLGLLRDPADNGGDASLGFGSTDPSDAEIKSAFCGDCHNKNVNWHGTPNDKESYGIMSHPIGNVDGEVNIYGSWKPVVNIADETKITRSCSSCHSASTETDDNGNYTGPSSFPHQSVGHKLLNDSYATLTNVVGFDYTGDPYRPLPNLDGGVCRKCHQKVGESSPQGF